MAQQGVRLDRETFSCPVCLELLSDPVTIPCGHNFCLHCIQEVWERNSALRYSCPTCRKRFRTRPELQKNTMLAALVEHMENAYARGEDVACDVCSGRKLKALKSCLECLASFCESHLQPHRDVAHLKKHQLVEPTQNLQENVCPRHDKLMEMFCRTDQQCVCFLCCEGPHQGHDTVSVAVARQEKEQEARETFQQTIRDREEEVWVLQQEVTVINHAADEAVEHGEKSYGDLIAQMTARRAELKQKIRSQQEAEVRRVKALQEKLEQRIAELRSKEEELQRMAPSRDHCSFLQKYLSESDLPGPTHPSSIHIRPCRYFHDVVNAVSESSQKIQEPLDHTWTNISRTSVDVLLSQPKSRAQFLQYRCHLTLDPDTAHPSLTLSQDNRRATKEGLLQPRPRHPDRFRSFTQVLSRESLSGRCYWEVKMEDGGVQVVMAYKSVNREGQLSMFGLNDESWALSCTNGRFGFMHNGDSSSINGRCPSSTVGVYLDHPAGLLAFFSVWDTMRLIHLVRTSFTQPLHAGIGFTHHSTVELVQLG